ncbi:MAG: hypothetical protein ACLUFK_12715, partial [Oscillospiraceae bacterium]
RLLHTQEVTGSSPAVSTKQKTLKPLWFQGFLVFRLLPFALHRAGNRNNARDKSSKISPVVGLQKPLRGYFWGYF